jgi:hypothetical protein
MFIHMILEYSGGKMKIVSAVILALGVGVALMGASVSPVAPLPEKKEAAIVVQPSHHTQEIIGAIKVIAPQKDLESAIRSSEKGDILLYGSEGWYRIDGKALQQGTKMYVLGSQGSMISVFPKEADHSTAR